MGCTDPQRNPLRGGYSTHRETLRAVGHRPGRQQTLRPQGAGRSPAGRNHRGSAPFGPRPFCHQFPAGTDPRRYGKNQPRSDRILQGPQRRRSHPCRHRHPRLPVGLPPVDGAGGRTDRSGNQRPRPDGPTFLFPHHQPGRYPAVRQCSGHRLGRKPL